MKHPPTLLLLVALSAAVSAGEPSRGERLAATCHACHGPEGRGSPPLPPLRGRSDIRRQLQAFQAAEAVGKAHLMTRLAQGLSEQDVDDLAAFYARDDSSDDSSDDSRGDSRGDSP